MLGVSDVKVLQFDILGIIIPLGYWCICKDKFDVSHAILSGRPSIKALPNMCTRIGATVLLHE